MARYIIAVAISIFSNALSVTSPPSSVADFASLLGASSSVPYFAYFVASPGSAVR